MAGSPNVWFEYELRNGNVVRVAYDEENARLNCDLVNREGDEPRHTYIGLSEEAVATIASALVEFKLLRASKRMKAVEADIHQAIADGCAELAADSAEDDGVGEWFARWVPPAAGELPTPEPKRKTRKKDARKRDERK